MSPIVDLFAGPGGWSEGLRMLGLSDIGIEWDRDACLTRRAAGHLTVRADVSQYPPEVFRGAWGLIASPPCPDWSTAGSGLGRAGDSGWLVDSVPAWVRMVRPEWIACEQVPPALVAWREHAAIYRELGYSVWTGILNAADYGVPQTRKRAVLVASRSSVAVPPAPTHAETPGMFGDRRWLAAADVLDLDRDDEIEGNQITSTTDCYYVRKADRPSPTLTSKAVSWRVNTRGERRTSGGNEFPLDRPSWSLAGRARSWTVLGDNDTSRRLTLAEGLTLQAFPTDYPVAGTWTSQWRQIGNAVPPLLAAHVLSAVTGCAIREPLEVAS